MASVSVPVVEEQEHGTAEQRLLARRERELAARAALSPLAPDERPRALLTAIGVAAVLAAGVLAGALSIHNLSRHGGSLPAGLFIAGVLLALANGMYRRRYWAVLSFEALLAFQIIVTSLALIVAETLLAAAICAMSIGLGGWLFWKLVRVMGRIQATEQQARSELAETDEELR
jgi:hypothetical protein